MDIRDDEARLLRLMTALDAASNMHGRLAPAQRVRVWKAIESGTYSDWNDARSILITERLTLWQAVCATGCPPQSQPTPEQLIEALEYAAQRAVS
jgi:hypothetical protein